MLGALLVSCSLVSLTQSPRRKLPKPAAKTGVQAPPPPSQLLVPSRLEIEGS